VAVPVICEPLSPQSMVICVGGGSCARFCNGIPMAARQRNTMGIYIVFVFMVAICLL